MARNRLVWLVCLSILCVVPASATFVPYTDLALWQQVTTLSGTVIDFDSELAPVGGHSTPTLSLAIGGITFTAPTPYPTNLVVVNANAGQSYYNWGTTSILRTEADGWPVKANWTPSVTAFAASMGINKFTTTYLPSQMDVTVRNGETIVWQQTLVTSAHPTLTFFGIVSTDPAERFDSVTFQPAEGNTTTAFLDNVRLGAYQAPAPDPEPTPELGTGVLSLCGGILLAAGGFRRHIKPS